MLKNINETIEDIPMSEVGILGAGTWGIALAKMLSNNGHTVTVWSAIESEIDALSATRRHPNLPDMPIPDAVRFTKSIAAACEGNEILLFAVPSVFIRDTAEKARPFISPEHIVVCLAKGTEPGTLYSMTQVISDVLNKEPALRGIRPVALSGPTHAEEVARDMLTTIVSACTDIHIAERVQDVFMNTCMRVYTHVDVHGVELCGAFKNIIALAAGILKTLGYGDNAKAALITRGMAEITRLGLAMGCMEQTFSGLAGIGDLIVTATSDFSRNNRCGQLIGQGVPPAEAVKQIGMVVEGIHALPAAMTLADRYAVEMPIVAAVNAVVHEGADPAKAVAMLMQREKKPEIENPLATASAGKKRILTYGDFPCIRYRQLQFFEQAKAQGDYLIVALLPSDTDSFAERKALLEAMHPVDLVVPAGTPTAIDRDMQQYRIDTVVLEDTAENRQLASGTDAQNLLFLPQEL